MAGISIEYSTLNLSFRIHPAAHQRRGFSHADVLPLSTKHRHDPTKMTPTIFARSRTWSARHALPPPCSSKPFSLPLPTQTQNGSQGRFCAKEGHIKNDHLPAANSRRGHGGVYLSALYTNKKKKKNFPLWCCPPVVCIFTCLLSALKSPTYQGFAGLADKADNTDNRVVKIVFLSARCPLEKGLGGQQPIWRTTIFRENLLSACCPPRAFVVRLKEFPSGMDMFFCREIGWKNII